MPGGSAVPDGVLTLFLFLSFLFFCLSFSSFFPIQDGARDAVGEYMEKNALTLLVVMTAVQTPAFHRELALIPAASLWSVAQ